MEKDNKEEPNISPEITNNPDIPSELEKSLSTFSYFNAPITNKYPAKAVSLKETFTLVISDNFRQHTESLRQLPSKKDKDAYKIKHLDYVTFSGQFSQRSNSDIIQRSEYFCIDLDKLNPTEIDAIKQSIISGLKPALLFISPKSNGLKVIYCIDPGSGEHLQFFFALKAYISNLIGKNIDEQCKDISRACFLCSDPAAYYNVNPDILGSVFLTQYSITDLELETVRKSIPFTSSNSESSKSAKDTLSALIHRAVDGEKHFELLKTSKLAGGFIAANHLSEDEAIDLLEKEIQKKNIDSFPKAQNTIRKGIQTGKNSPCHPKTSTRVFVELSGREFAVDVFKFERKGEAIFLNGLYRNGMIEKLTSLGYCKRYLSNNTYHFIKQVDNILDEVLPTIMKDEILAYLRAAYHVNLEFDYKGISVLQKPEKLIETFLNQSHLIFNDKFLEHLPTHTKPILKDTKTKAFFTFSNVIVRVTADEIKQIQYSDLKEYCIWRKHILKRPFQEANPEGCEFEDFIKNVSGDQEDRFRAFISAIGYLLHNFNNKTKGQAVLAYDEEITDPKEPQGGTGKGIIQQALRQLRHVAKIDGKKFNENDRFCFQEIDELTQVAFFDDVKADMGFERFHSILTEGWNIEKKNKQATFIQPEDSPKVYITSNAIIKGEGSTNERRQFIIEFAPFYRRLIRKKLEPIVYTHGSEFFSDDWSAEEWHRFYNFMLNCCLYYLKYGLHYYKYVGLNQNKLRQYTSAEFCEWVKQRAFGINTEYNLSLEYNEFKATYYGDGSDFKQRTFTIWLKQYASSEGVELKTRRSNNNTLFKTVIKSA